MAARVIQINSFCGGSSKLLDSEFIGMEESLNMYPETVTATDTYSTKILKSVEGFTQGALFAGSSAFGFEEYCGKGVVNQNPFGVGPKDSLLIVTRGHNQPTRHAVYVTTPSIGNAWQTVGMFTASNARNAFISELPNGLALILIGEKIFAADPTSTAEPAPELDEITLPNAFDHAGKIKPTQIAQLNFRVILNDKNRDYIYWSEINRPNDVSDVHAFEQNLTQYAYTKTDGTVVTFDDNVFYAPAEGSYIPGSLTTQQVYTSSLNSMKMDFKADNVVAMRATDTSLFVFGNNSLEILRWQNSTVAPFAIVNKTSLAGVSFEKAVTIIGNECYFVGKGPSGMYGVWAVDENGTVRKVSTNAIDQVLASYNRLPHVIKDIETFEYSYKGHQFFVFNVYDATDSEKQDTYCFDLVEHVWTTRASFDKKNVRYAWNAVDAVSLDGFPFFVTHTKIGRTRVCNFDPESSTDHFNDEDNQVVERYFIQRERVTGIKYDGINDIIVTGLELILNNGVTKQIEPNEAGFYGDKVAHDPKVMLQVSTDGGRSWSNELWAYAGRTGQYSWRTRWNSLGKGARFAFRVKMTDPVPFEIATAYLSYIPCGNRV